ncbi:hypothetical protein BGZ51_005279 [Haplosporangium sp. Z 767]|nr:hypothetical protein BGZ51_005279 [Haplosporangium sp. Z 767]KAF9191359.1 hypothetical protein BGZ50_009414 [Haplosporangium sp. Z 11]
MKTDDYIHIPDITCKDKSLGYIVVGVNEFYASKKCAVCEGFVDQANIRQLYCPTCEINAYRDVMTGHNIANIVRHHLVHQQRPLYLQSIDSQERYPWMDGSSSSSGDGGGGGGSDGSISNSESGSGSGSDSGSDRKRQEQGPAERPNKTCQPTHQSLDLAKGSTLN